MTVYECEECGGTIFSWNVTKYKCRPRFRIVCDEVCPESAYFRHAASAEDAFTRAQMSQRIVGVLKRFVKEGKLRKYGREWEVV